MSNKMAPRGTEGLSEEDGEDLSEDEDEDAASRDSGSELAAFNQVSGAEDSGGGSQVSDGEVSSRF